MIGRTLVAGRRNMRAMGRVLLLAGLASALYAARAVGKEGSRNFLSSFETSAEGWYVYDYNGGIDGGGNVFYPVPWQKTGGVRNSGFIWADDSRWRVDLPEQPN